MWFPEPEEKDSANMILGCALLNCVLHSTHMRGLTFTLASNAQQNDSLGPPGPERGSLKCSWDVITNW